MNLVKPSYGMVVIDKQANTLLVQQYGKSWCPPKGRMESVDEGNPIKTASRELREETGYSSSFSGGEIIPNNVGMPKPRITYAKDREQSTKDNYIPMSTTITRPTFMGKPEPGWFGPMRRFTYYLGLCQDLHKIDFSGIRDKAITNMKILHLSELKLMARPCNASDKFNWNCIHLEDYHAIGLLLQMAAEQWSEALEDAKKN